jgi:molybdopterin synthase sulfur carrier subunit
MQVTVYGPLRSATGKKTVSLAFDGGTVEEALAVFIDKYPRAKFQLYGDDGRLRSSARISVNGERVDVDDACPGDAELTVFPPVQGGGRDRQ